jgi:hypothetical protein
MSEGNDGRTLGFLKISLIGFITYSLGFFPLIIYGKIVLTLINFEETWHLLVLPFLIYIGIALTIWYLLLITGIIIHIFNIKYKPGVYPYNFKNKMATKWSIICTLYTPMRKMLEIFPIGAAKIRYFRLLGMKIGENTLVGGTIMDPCITEFGDNCTMGLYAAIYGHIHDYENETLTLSGITIGNNCMIGAGAFIMPGVVIEDNVKVAAGAVVTKGSRLKKGKTYAGIPAKELGKKK